MRSNCLLAFLLPSILKAIAPRMGPNLSINQTFKKVVRAAFAKVLEESGLLLVIHCDKNVAYLRTPLFKLNTLGQKYMYIGYKRRVSIIMSYYFRKFSYLYIEPKYHFFKAQLFNLGIPTYTLIQILIYGLLR